MGRSFPGDKEGKLFQVGGTFTHMPRGRLVRSWSMGSSRGRESSGLAVKSVCVMQGIGLHPVDSGGLTEVCLVWSLRR